MDNQQRNYSSGEVEGMPHDMSLAWYNVGAEKQERRKTVYGIHAQELSTLGRDM